MCQFRAVDSIFKKLRFKSPLSHETHWLRFLNQSLILGLTYFTVLLRREEKIGNWGATYAILISLGKKAQWKFNKSNKHIKCISLPTIQNNGNVILILFWIAYFTNCRE